MTSPNRSAAERVYSELKRRILTLHWGPGTFLSENRLATDFGVSRTPAREALQRLSREGLVEVIPKQGTFVSNFPSASEIRHIYELREALAGMSARLSAMRATAADIADLRGILFELETLNVDERDRRGALSARFITRLDEIGGNDLILEINRNLLDRLFWLSQAVIIKDSMYLLTSTARRHELVAAISGGDADLAESLARDIVSYVKLEALKFVAEGPSRTDVNLEVFG